MLLLLSVSNIVKEVESSSPSLGGGWRRSFVNLSSTRGGSLPSSSQGLYDTNFDDEYSGIERKDKKEGGFKGMGREFDLFNGNVYSNTAVEDTPRGGDSSSPLDDISARYNAYKTGLSTSEGGSSSTNRYRKRRSGSSGRSRSSTSSATRATNMPNIGGGSSQPSNQNFNPIQSVRSWISENQSSIPRIQVRVEPNTTLKLRKRFRPLFKTLVTLGADFNTQLGVWQFRSSWEDSIIGGRLTLAGRELQMSKTWLLSVGAVEDLVTRLRLRAAIDLGTGKAYARLGFRTERLSPINVVEGFTLLRQLPLDGPEGKIFAVFIHSHIFSPCT